jgi:hypothetical protein
VLLYHWTTRDRAVALHSGGFDPQLDWRRGDGAWFCDDPTLHDDCGDVLLVVEIPAIDLALCRPTECVKRDGTVGEDCCVPADIASRYLRDEEDRACDVSLLGD